MGFSRVLPSWDLGDTWFTVNQEVGIVYGCCLFLHLQYAMDFTAVLVHVELAGQVEGELELGLLEETIARAETLESPV